MLGWLFPRSVFLSASLKLIANASSYSPRAYICSECIFVCHSVLSDGTLEDLLKRGQ
jgi:hypothetical protein